MRLLHVTHQYWPAIGGAEQYIVQLSETLATRGHEVHLYTARSRDADTWRNELPAAERVNGVSVRRFWSLPRRSHTWTLLHRGVERWTVQPRRRYEPMIWYGNGPVMPLLVPTLLREARRFDLIHINQLHYAHAWPTAWVARRLEIPYLVTPNIHIEQPVTYTFPYLRHILHHATGVIAQTPVEAAFLRSEGLGRFITVGGVGLDLAAYPPRAQGVARERLGLPQDAPILLFLGRKVEYKGLHVLLRAFVALREAFPKLILLAMGPETDYSAQLWRDYAGIQGVVVRGTVTDDERLDALAACDILAVPSTGESFGIVYLEAWAYGRPVVGARIQAVQSLVDDTVNGFLIDPEDEGVLARRLRDLLTSAERRQQMGAAGRAKLERRYTSERVGDIIEGACYRAVRHHRAFQQG